MKSDEQLMLEYQAGSSQAFEALFERYRNSIYGFFRRRLNNSARAEELSQDTFIVILRGAERYEAKAQFRTYMYSIAIKQLWSERRKELRNERLATEVTQERPVTSPADSLWVRDALGQLDEDHREVLMLREYEQLRYDEIADVLGIPVNTVRSRLSRARSELKTVLQLNSARGVTR